MEFKEMIYNLTKQVETHKELKIFVNFFEAFIGYSKFYQVQDNAGVRNTAKKKDRQI